MASVKASVVIPAYNAEKTVGECLQSITSQTPGFSFEVILVDDGSTDKTIEIAGSFPKTKVIRQDHDGPAVARNKGAKSALGEIIVFTDSDCVADKNWLKEMVRPFDQNEIAGVQGRYKSRQKEIIARLIQLEIEQRYKKMAKDKFIDFIGTYSAGYKKSVFLKLKGFDTSFPIASGEDTDFSFRVNEAGYKMVFNQDAIIFHTHPSSLKKYVRIKFFRAFWRMKVYKGHQAKMVRDSYTSHMVKFQTGLFVLSTAVLLSGLLYPILFTWAGLGYALLFVTTLRFAVWAFARDPVVGLISPVTSLLATAAFGFGLVLGTLRELLGK